MLCVFIKWRLNNCILLGDFNLNFAKKNDINYSHVRYFDDFEEMLGDENLVQIIEFPTWSRIVNNVLLESTIDLNDITIHNFEFKMYIVCRNLSINKPL